MFLAIFSVPKAAEAGVFSFVSGFFTTTSAQTVTATSDTDMNSQQITLLQAPLNPDITATSTTAGPTTLVTGNSLVSSAGPEGSAADVASLPTSDEISTYTVQPGDTLQSVAKMFNVTTNTVAWANDISAKAALHVGDTLVILPISGIQHTVKKGETLKSIAKDFSGNVDDIAQFNNLADNASLTVGETIIIPDGELSAPPTTTSSKASSSKSSKKSSLVPASTTDNPDTTAPLLDTGSEGGSSGSSIEPVVSSSDSDDHMIDPNGYFIRPITGGVRTQGLHGHNGVDLASAKGTPIMAAADGVVIISRSSGWNGGYGQYIVISHPNGMQTLYAHLSENDVSVNDEVKQGQVIGLMGETGLATGYHVHFEVRGGANPF